MASRKGLAVLGPGRMGLVHMKNILMSPRASLKWIVRNNIAEAEEFVNTYDLPTRCATPKQINEVLDDPSVHGVVICSPSSTHEEVITASLKAGKTVFCEKPITTDLKSTEACYNLAESQGRHLFCAFHRRFDPSFKAVHDKIRSGALGGLRMVRTSSRDYNTPSVSYLKSSGGIFFDTVVHDLDITGWMIGSRPTQVFSQGHAFIPEFAECNDLDLQLTSVKFENGVVAVLDNLRQSLYGYDQRFEAVCEKGMLTVENTPMNFMTEHGPQTTASPRAENEGMVRYDKAYANEMEHFLDILEGKTLPLVTKEEALQAMRLADACKESFQAGKPVAV